MLMANGESDRFDSDASVPTVLSVVKMAVLHHRGHRGQIEKDLGIPGSNVIVDSSHCHGVVRTDSSQLVMEAIKEATAHLEPVRIGTGTGMETRISENRRLRLKDGTEAAVRARALEVLRGL